jgi:hypothetical protein
MTKSEEGLAAKGRREAKRKTKMTGTREMISIHSSQVLLRLSSLLRAFAAMYFFGLRHSDLIRVSGIRHSDLAPRNVRG